HTVSPTGTEPRNNTLHGGRNSNSPNAGGRHSQFPPLKSANRNTHETCAKNFCVSTNPRRGLRGKLTPLHGLVRNSAEGPLEANSLRCGGPLWKCYSQSTAG